jgi:four helix bundle protein
MRDGERESRDPGRTRIVRRHRDLEVYQKAYAAAMRICECSKAFPTEERYSLTDQVRRSSRSVCANRAEGWRQRRYPAAFVSKLTDSEGEAAETQVWLEFAKDCGYLTPALFEELHAEYDAVLGMLVNMATRPKDWCFDRSP